ncbi:MAG TPA: DNA polymerase IV [Nitrososphaerales archaeon]|nr:DNA polymerase IV [Nitrososphaerales archaeon]
MTTEKPLSEDAKRERVVLAVDLDYFFAQCEEVRKPELKGRPVVVCVYSGRTEESGAVSTSNYIARRLGVRSGIPIISAKRILKNHPEAVFLPIDKEYYESVSERIMEIMRSESRAESFEKVSIDEAFLDISSVVKGDFQSAKEIAQRVKQSILESEGLTCSVGVSINKLLAKMAADHTKPDGLTVVTQDQIHEFLDDLPVSKLQGIGPKTEQKLQSMGIGKVSELARLDRERLATEFGRKLGPHLGEIAQGIDDTPVKEREIEQLSRIITLKHDATSLESFSDELTPLVSDICARLDSGRLSCTNVSVIAITTELKTKSRAHALETPTRSEKVILDLARELFSRFFSEEVKDGGEEKTTRVRRVGVRVSGLKQEVEKGRAQPSPSLTDYFGV